MGVLWRMRMQCECESQDMAGRAGFCEADTQAEDTVVVPPRRRKCSFLIDVRFVAGKKHYSARVKDQRRVLRSSSFGLPSNYKRVRPGTLLQAKRKNVAKNVKNGYPKVKNVFLFTVPAEPYNKNKRFTRGCSN